MHEEASNFIEFVAKTFPEYFKNVKVLDAGSFDVNGNNRYLFKDSKYIGADVASGKNVDIISKISDLKFEDEYFDVIISSESLEHDLYYPETLESIIRMLKKDGLLIITCGFLGRAEHGTFKYKPHRSLTTQTNDSNWENYYKSLSKSNIVTVIDVHKIFQIHQFYMHMRCDLYFWGIKKGTKSIDFVPNYQANHVRPLIF